MCTVRRMFKTRATSNSIHHRTHVLMRCMMHVIAWISGCTRKRTCQLPSNLALVYFEDMWQRYPHLSHLAVVNIPFEKLFFKMHSLAQSAATETHLSSIWLSVGNARLSQTLAHFVRRDGKCFTYGFMFTLLHFTKR